VADPIALLAHVNDLGYIVGGYAVAAATLAAYTVALLARARRARARAEAVATRRDADPHPRSLRDGNPP